MNRPMLMLGALWTVLGPAAAAADSLDRLVLPEGFSISVYADGIESARQMALGDRATVFVGTRRSDKVYALADRDGDQRADQVRVIDEGLEMPSGVAFLDGDLYVGAVSRVLRYRNIESRLHSPPEPEVVTDALPPDRPHGWKHLRFGPDGRLYVPVGVPCNVCESPGHGEIRRLDVVSGAMETFARGIRNSVGMAIHPQTGALWFTDNGRDHLGDELPSDELNHAPRAGMHFGFPYCHQGDLPDPEFGAGHNCSDYEPPVVRLGPHVAPLGLAFYTGEMFPAAYRGQLIVAEHGSWNRTEKIGYRLKLVQFDGQGAFVGQQVFVEGWLQGQDNWGRPVDVMVMPDGALLVSDDQAGRIYRIHYGNDT